MTAEGANQEPPPYDSLQHQGYQPQQQTGYELRQLTGLPSYQHNIDPPGLD